jgi:hypothetical protein
MNQERRIILRHTAGSHPGLRQIVGLTSTLGELPEVLKPIIIAGREASARRLKSTNRYVAYVEAPYVDQEAAQAPRHCMCGAPVEGETGICPACLSEALVTEP